MSRSEKQRERAKRIIAEIIREAGGTCEDIVLDMAFYYAHLKYASDNPGYLSTWPIIKMPHGPGIDNVTGLIADLVAEQTIKVHEVPGQAVKRFSLTQNGSGSALTEAETAAIRYAVRKVEKMKAKRQDGQLVDSRAWRDASEGQELSIYTDTLTGDEYEERRKSAQETAEVLGRSWGEITGTTNRPSADTLGVPAHPLP